MCNLRISELSDVTIQIYGVLFALSGVIAAVCNTLAVIVLWLPGQQTRLNRILTSLVISDVVSGYIIYPLSAYQVTKKDALKQCSIDIARTYFGAVVVASSTITICILSIDRYLILTKLHKYNNYMTMKKTSALLLLGWLISICTPALRIVRKQAYLTTLFLICGVPLFVIITNYCIIVKVIYNHESSSNSGSISGSFIGRAPSHQAQPTTDRSARATRRHLNLAKQFLLLTTFDVVCVVPLLLWTILDLINNSVNIMDTKHLHHCYIFANITAGLNSCFNPFIYVWKNPEFRKGIRKVVSWKKFRIIHPKF